MLKSPLYPSRSEHFPYDEKTFMYGDTPIMHFDAGAGPAIVLVHGLGANLTHPRERTPMIPIHCAVSHLESTVSSLFHQPSPLFVGAGLAVFMCCMLGYQFDNLFRH